jgi:hypothetical protein
VLATEVVGVPVSETERGALSEATTEKHALPDAVATSVSLGRPDGDNACVKEATSEALLTPEPESTPDAATSCDATPETLAA